MSGEARYLEADRSQLRWDVVDLESLLASDHRARVVWAYVCALDLSGFYARIRAREGEPGRAESPPGARERAERRLPAGERISQGFLLTPPIVHRGDKVFIVVRKGALALRIQGEAMQDGAAGETIRVRPEQSKKIIEAVIRSKEEVEVRIP